MNRGKQCPAVAVIQAIAERDLEVVPLPHYVRFADDTRVTWDRDGEIVHV